MNRKSFIFSSFLSTVCAFLSGKAFAEPRRSGKIDKRKNKYYLAAQKWLGFVPFSEHNEEFFVFKNYKAILKEEKFDTTDKKLLYVFGFFDSVPPKDWSFSNNFPIFSYIYVWNERIATVEKFLKQISKDIKINAKIEIIDRSEYYTEFRIEGKEFLDFLDNYYRLNLV